MFLYGVLIEHDLRTYRQWIGSTFRSNDLMIQKYIEQLIFIATKQLLFR